MMSRPFANEQVNWALLDQILVSGTNFFTGLILTRFLGLESFGQFTLLWMVVLFVNSLLYSMNSAPMMTLGPQQKNNAKSYFKAVSYLQFILSIFSSVLVFITLQLVDILLPSWQLSYYSYLLTFALFFCLNQDFFRRLLFTLGESKYAFLIDVMRYGSQLVFLFIFYFYNEISVAIVMTIIIISAAIPVLIVSVLLIYRFGLYGCKITKLRNVFLSNWKSSKWMTASAIMEWTSGQFFVIMSGAFLGAYAAGVIKACENIIGITNIVIQGIENFAPRNAARAYSKLGIKGLLSYTKELALLGGLFIGSILLFISLSSDFILVFIYGNEYESYGGNLIWLAIANFIGFMGVPIGIALRVLEKTKVTFIACFVSSVFSLLSAYVLIELFSINGAIAGYLMAKVILIGLMFIGLYRSDWIRWLFFPKNS